MRLHNPSLALAGAALLATVTAQNVFATVIQVSPGPTVTGAPGPILNGSTTSLDATGTTLNAVFVGFSAADTDVLSITGHPEFTPITNTISGFQESTATGLTVGQVIPFVMTNNSTGSAFAPGTAYTNTDSGMFSPVYHYAEFTGITDAAVFNGSPLASGPSPVTITPGGVVDTFLIANGGYSSYLFVGVEDLSAAGTDDWNDLIYAFQGVTPVSMPEPASMLLLGSALVGFGIARRRRNRK